MRALSGAANGAGYARKWEAFIGFCALFSFTCFFAMHRLGTIGQIFMLVSTLAVIGKIRAFNGKKTIGTADIHLWENVVMLPVPIALFLGGESLAMVALSLYPGLFLHKAAINIGSGIDLFDDQTDDATGATYGMSLPAWLVRFGLPERIAVPRTTQKTRLVLASFCAAVAIHLPALDWRVSFLSHIFRIV